MRSSLHRKLLMSSGGHLKGMLGQFFFFSSFVWRIGATIKYCLAQLRYKSLWRSGYGRRQTKDTFIINLFITNFKISAPLFSNLTSSLCCALHFVCSSFFCSCTFFVYFIFLNRWIRWTCQIIPTGRALITCRRRKDAAGCPLKSDENSVANTLL